MIKQVIKRDGTRQKFSLDKIRQALIDCYDDIHASKSSIPYIMEEIQNRFGDQETINIEKIQNIIEETLMKAGEYKVAKHYIQYRADHKKIRDFVNEKKEYIEQYKKSYNTADATIDDNSNVKSKNIGIINSEIHKPDNMQVNRGLVMSKLKELYPNFDAKQYIRDLEHHIIYKHDENSFCIPAPYCCSISMYPFLLNGLKDLGGLSAAPKNLDSYCGLLVNLVFAISSQFLGACALPEALMIFDYFTRKEWGDDYYLHVDDIVNPRSNNPRTIQQQIHQYFQQIIYSVNQPAASRGMQSSFINFSYYDKPFFTSLFDGFVFPDGTSPKWESINWLQKDFMQWFNEERLKTVITFPVETFALIYKDGKFEDEENARFVADEQARGHSFFIYISDSADSLSSCCFDGDEIIHIYNDQEGEFYTSIKDFVDSQIHETCEYGEKIKNKYFTNSYNIDNDNQELSKITGILKKNYSGKMYKIYTDENNYITVTADHILKCITPEGNPVEIRADELYKHEDYQLVVEKLQ